MSRPTVAGLNLRMDNFEAAFSRLEGSAEANAALIEKTAEAAAKAVDAAATAAAGVVEAAATAAALEVRLTRMDLNGHTVALKQLAIASPDLIKLAEAAPTLIDKVEKAHSDEMFWQGFKQRMGWASGWPKRIVAIVGFVSTLGWAILAFTNLAKTFPH